MDKETTVNAQHPKLIEITAESAPPAESSAGTDRMITAIEAKKGRGQDFLRGLSKLRVLLPVASGALRMVDHGAVQALARLLPLLEGGAPPSRGVEEVQQGFANIQQDNSDLLLQIQSQTAQLKRLEEQITRLREATDRNAAWHLGLVEDIKSVRNLIRGLGGSIAILLVLLIVLAGLLLLHMSR